jgi:hypothetical protein
MKIRIQNFPIHQNAKVLAVLMAVSSLAFVLPAMLVFGAVGPKELDGPGPWILLSVPVIYLVGMYAVVAVGCWVYNHLRPLTGGFEFDARDVTGS